MNVSNSLRRMWQSILNIPRWLSLLFEPAFFEDDQELETEPTTIILTPRDPKVDPRQGDVFSGIFGGVRTFQGFDEKLDEVLFTRPHRPNRCREPREKWFVWVQNATVISAAS